MEPVSYTELRKNLKKIMDKSADSHEPVIIKRPKGETMILLPLSSYESLKETAYLLSNEANAKHLRASIESLKSGAVKEAKLDDE
jgi:antitoxin YefM